MRLFLEVVKVTVLVPVLFALTACASMDNDGYRGGDHRGGGPSGVYGLPDAKVSTDKSDKAVKQDNATEEDIYTGGDHRGGGPHGPLV